MKLLFIGLGDPEIEFYIKISTYLRKIIPAAEVTVLVHYVRQMRAAEAGSDVKVVAFPEWIAESGIKIADFIAERERVVSEYDLTSIKQIYFTDRDLMLSSGGNEQRAILHVRAAENFLTECRPDIIVSAVGGELGRTAVFLVARKRGIKTLFFNYFPLPGKFALIPELGSNFISYGNEDLAALTGSDLERGRMLCASIKRREHKIGKWEKPALRKEYFAKFFSRLYYSLIGDEHAFPTRWWVVKKLSLIMCRIFNRFAVVVFYSRPREGEKYIFFPLHDAGDYQLKGRAPHCAYQEFIIKLLADSVPEGFRIYVKEHPVFIGGIGFSTMRRISSIPEVRVLDPGMDSISLINGSELVVTVNSTCGFEAIILGKQVVTLGAAYYRGKGLTVDVTDFSQLRETIKIALRTDPPKEQDVIRAVAMMDKSTYPGSFVGDNIDMSEKNVHLAGEAILKNIRL